MLESTAIDELYAGFNGLLILPGDPDYDEARKIFNGMIDKRPALIAQCASAGDVVRALRFGREQGFEIAVRGGGHGVSGLALSEGGLVIDLRRMNAVSVDPARRVATVAGGATMGHLDRATGAHGLATTGGRVSTTGVGGFTLGGGSGWLERKWGLTCDNLVAVELVTADGELVRAAADENPELFWALHGGGGNFGVATSFELRLHPLRSVTALMLFWHPEAGPEAVRAYRDFMEGAPDRVGGGVFFLTGPDEAFVPERLRGRPALMILIVHAGPEEEARRTAAPMLACRPESMLIKEMPYADLQCLLDDPPGFRNYWSAEHLGSLPDPAVDLFCARARDLIVPSPSQHVLFPMGGAVKRGPSGFPIPWRKAAWVAHPFGLWENPADDERARRWAHAIREDLKPWSMGAVYLNFIGDEGEARVMAGFGRENYERLARVKAEFDPKNVFHLNHNIKPA
jgi:FAD/FMN-containing dehydrogenase